MNEQRFLQMLQRHRNALSSKLFFSGLLRDYFPQERLLVNLMVHLFEMGIRAEIDSAPEATKAFGYRFVKRLMDEYGVSRENADNVVGLFCKCYGKGVKKKPCDWDSENGGKVASKGSGNTNEANNLKTNTGQSSSPGQNKAQHTAVVSQPASVVEISVVQLLRAYEANAIATEEQYKGKVLRVTGVVSSIEKIHGEICVIIDTGKKVRWSHVQAEFRDDQRAQVAALRKGQTITFYTSIDEVSALSLIVWLKDCRFS